MNTIAKSDATTNEEHRQLISLIEAQKAEIFRLKNILDTLPGSIYWKDINGVYLGRNAYSHDKMRSVDLEVGTKQDSVIGLTDYDIFVKEVADKYRQHDLEVMESGRELVREEAVTLPNGKEIIQLSSKKPLRDEKGNIVGIVGNTIDITYLKKMEKELREATEKLEKSNVIKTDFIRNMEHDIRTPFSGVWGISNMLWQRTKDPETKELLGDITHCAKELLDYCNGILDYAKVEEGNLPLIEKKFNLNHLLESVLAMEMPPAKLKKLDLILEIKEKLPMILVGDSYRLQRILINLVSNAIKFTQQGYVRLSVKLAKRVNEKQIILRFFVEDTGIGIPQDKQDFIYEKFAKVIPSNKGTYKGIGLGLRMVKQFLEEMNGEIDLQSEMGLGSTFICTLPFKLPLLNEIVETHENSEIKNNVESSKIKVLLVEDIKIAQKTAILMLEQLNCEVDAADSGAQALQLVQEKNHDIIFMDLGLGDMDGLTVTETIRKMGGKRRNIPIIALTAHSDENIKAKCFDAGINDFIEKPISMETSCSILQKYISE